MYEERCGSIKTNLKDKPIFEEHKEIFSFLICNKLAFDLENIDFEEIYEEIPEIQYRHNLILSLQDGLFCYLLEPEKFPPKQREAYMESFGKDTEATVWYYPHRSILGECHHCNSEFIKAKKENECGHVMDFLICIRMLLELSYEYKLDFVQYLVPKDNIVDLLD